MSAKKRSKSKIAVKTEGSHTKARRAEELRALFNESADAGKSVVKTEVTKTEMSVAQTMATPTPTPTVPTHATSSNATGKIHAPAFEKSAPIPRPEIRTVISQKPYAAAKRIDLAAKERDRETAWWLGPALIIGALAMLAIGWLHVQRSGIVDQPVGHPTATMNSFARETKSKIDFYRNQLGHRLNRDRVNVEIMNSRVAPSLDATLSPKVDRSMMRGVPLMQENYVDQNYGSRMKTDPVPSDHPDARIQYGLQEEQHRDEFDRRVQQEYLREFVENARLDGVKVVLDKEGNVVQVEEIRGGGSGFNGSGSNRSPGGYSSGSAR